MTQSVAVPRVAAERCFADSPITALSLDGDILIPVIQFEAALGYKRRALVTLVRRWQQDRLLRPEHTTLIDRRALKRIDQLIVDRSLDAQSPDDVGQQATKPSLTLDLSGRSDLLCLTERGVYRVLMLSRRPQAVAFQDWLEGEVLPQIARTGRYAAVPDVPSTTAPSSPPAPLPRRRRSLPAPSVLPVGGHGTPRLAQLRAEILDVVVNLPMGELVALHEMLLAEGHGGHRYWRAEGITDAQLRQAMAQDLWRLSPDLRDQVARWLSTLLGRERAAG